MLFEGLVKKPSDLVLEAYKLLHYVELKGMKYLQIIDRQTKEVIYEFNVSKYSKEIFEEFINTLEQEINHEHMIFKLVIR